MLLKVSRRVAFLTHTVHGLVVGGAEHTVPQMCMGGAANFTPRTSLLLPLLSFSLSSSGTSATRAAYFERSTARSGSPWGAVNVSSSPGSRLFLLIFTSAVPSLSILNHTGFASSSTSSPVSALRSSYWL